MTNKIKDKKWFTPVRFSHLTGHQAAGAIVRDQFNWLMCVSDTSQWQSEKMPQLHAVERVKHHLNVSERLLEPPVASLNSRRAEGGTTLAIHGCAIPATLFPSWMMCSNCNYLYFKPWKNIKPFNPDKTCSCSRDECRNTMQTGAAKLEQVTWCAVSSTGALIDVPWHYICHNNNQITCPRSHNEAYLKINNNNGQQKIACTLCGAQQSFDRTDRVLAFKHIGRHIDQNKPISCLYTIMEINDPRVHISQRQRALVIPPESNISKQSLEYKLQQDSQLVASILNAETPFKIKSSTQVALNKYNCNREQLLAALNRIERIESNNFDHVSNADMHRDEYDALCRQDADMHPDADFVTRDLTGDWCELVANADFSESLQLIGKLVERLVAVDRLRVIEVFKGFTRIASDYDDLDPKPMQPPDLLGELDWLPAIELFGEGLFFTLDITTLQTWQQQQAIIERAAKIEARYQPDNMLLPDDVEPSARFILLHTLAHIIIRELEATAGYPAASLQERIFCADDMAGVLIYTAVPDIAGSLGGIIEQAQPINFIRILDAALRRAAWCSSDPVCAECEGQGPSWLNLAACHGCALVPDTACEYGNVFLDRVLLKGNNDIPAIIDIR